MTVSRTGSAVTEGGESKRGLSTGSRTAQRFTDIGVKNTTITPMNWINTQDEPADQRGVSPVIGVILMVAVTVTLAAVVSTLVLGLNNDVEANPQASFGFDYSNTTLEITHEGGSTLDISRVDVLIGGESNSWNDTDGKISGGDSNTFNASSGEKVNIIWEGPNENSAIIGSYTVPS